MSTNIVRDGWERIWKDFEFIQSNPVAEKYDLFTAWDGPAGQSFLLRRIIESTSKCNFHDWTWLKFDADYDSWFKKFMALTPGGPNWNQQKEWIESYFREGNIVNELMEKNPPVVTGVETAHLHFGWGWTGCGFGELYIKYDAKTGKYYCDHECMGKESVRKFLHALADHITDNLRIP